MLQINPGVQADYLGTPSRSLQRYSNNALLNKDQSSKVESSNISPSSFRQSFSHQSYTQHSVVTDNNASQIVQSLDKNQQISDFSLASSRQPPVAQYQLNEQLLRREELGKIVGIDVFA